MNIFFVVVMIMIVLHQVFRCIRFRATAFGQKLAERDLGINSRAVLLTIERDCPPTIMAMTFAMTLGHFRFFLAFVFVVSLVGAYFVFLGYTPDGSNEKYMKIGRIMLVSCTVLIYLNLLIASDIGKLLTNPTKPLK